VSWRTVEQVAAGCWLHGAGRCMLQHATALLLAALALLHTAKTGSTVGLRECWGGDWGMGKAGQRLNRCPVTVRSGQRTLRAAARIVRVVHSRKTAAAICNKKGEQNKARKRKSSKEEKNKRKTEHRSLPKQSADMEAKGRR
jgi:hypothetical protein